MTSDELKELTWATEGRLPLVLLEIDHDDLASPLRVVNDRQNVTLGGDEYVALPFELSLPSSPENSPPTARLRIDNVSREVGEAVRSITTPASVRIRVVRVDEPVTDPPTVTVEADLPGFVLRNATVTALTVEGQLDLEDLVREPFPARVFSPAEFPGLVS